MTAVKGGAVHATWDSVVSALLTLVLGMVVGLVRLLPSRIMPYLAALIVIALRPFAGRELRQLRRNVHQVLGLPPGSSFARRFERQVMGHQVVAGLETIRAIHTPEMVKIVGFAELQTLVAQAAAGGKGYIFITAHLGSWELCAYYARLAGNVPLAVLAKPPKMAVARRVLNSWRERMGVTVLWTDRKTLLREMLGTLKAKGALGFVMDQKPEHRLGLKVPFLGRPTEFVSGPGMVAARTGCPVISIFCLREGPWQYRLESRLLAPASDAPRDEAELTTMMAAEIEGMIRAYPEQWTWNYKRWRGL